MVGRVLQEGVVELRRRAPAEHDPDRAEAVAEWAALAGKHVASQGVEPPEELAGLEVDVFVAALELVEFLEHGDRHGDVVLSELPQATAVVKNDVGVEDEELRSGVRHRSSSERPAAIPAAPPRIPPSEWYAPRLPNGRPISRAVPAASVSFS